MRHIRTKLAYKQVSSELRKIVGFSVTPPKIMGVGVERKNVQGFALGNTWLDIEGLGITACVWDWSQGDSRHGSSVAMITQDEDRVTVRVREDSGYYEFLRDCRYPDGVQVKVMVSRWPIKIEEAVYTIIRGQMDSPLMYETSNITKQALLAAQALDNFERQKGKAWVSKRRRYRRKLRARLRRDEKARKSSGRETDERGGLEVGQGRVVVNEWQRVPPEEPVFRIPI